MKSEIEKRVAVIYLRAKPSIKKRLVQEAALQGISESAVAEKIFERAWALGEKRAPRNSRKLE